MNVMKIIRSMKGVLMPLAVVAAILCFAAALNNLDSGHRDRDISQLEQSIRRSSAAYYAQEGIYPRDLAALKDRFGIQIDDRYMVDYRIIADNLMPDITVLENK